MREQQMTNKVKVAGYGLGVIIFSGVGLGSCWFVEQY
jgi:hypothetical protein